MEGAREGALGGVMVIKFSGPGEFYKGCYYFFFPYLLHADRVRALPPPFGLAGLDMPK